jgi:DNA-binding NarL/FixJ family response regulator
MSEPRDNNRQAREVVLVVDDSPSTLNLLTDALETIGVTVLVSPSGEHALSVVDRVTPDVVLLDAIMPGLDGFEVCRRLKARREFQNVPVIFMTGLSATEHIVKALECGGVDYLTKPVSPDELIARMHVHIANARVTRSAQVALDKSRRFLVACSEEGGVLWSTPEAGRLLATGLPGLSETAHVLDPKLGSWLADNIAGRGAAADFDYVVQAPSDVKLVVSYLGEASAGEHVLRIVEQDLEKDIVILAGEFGLTRREAEIALWLSQGKSNKEIAAILDMSPRTVNKHLETSFEKLAVDNRTSAATRIIRTLASPTFKSRD